MVSKIRFHMISLICLVQKLPSSLAAGPKKGVSPESLLCSSRPKDDRSKTPLAVRGNASCIVKPEAIWVITRFILEADLDSFSMEVPR